MKDPFAERRLSDPQGLIGDLVAQTTRQAKSINELNSKLEKLQIEYEKLARKFDENTCNSQVAHRWNKPK